MGAREIEVEGGADLKHEAAPSKVFALKPIPVSRCDRSSFLEPLRCVRV